MARITLTIPAPDVPDLLEALEGLVGPDIRVREKGRGRDYDALGELERLEACLRDLLRRRTAGRRRERAAEKLDIPEPDL